ALPAPSIVPGTDDESRAGWDVVRAGVPRASWDTLTGASPSLLLLRTAPQRAKPVLAGNRGTACGRGRGALSCRGLGDALDRAGRARGGLAARHRAADHVAPRLGRVSRICRVDGRGLRADGHTASLLSTARPRGGRSSGIDEYSPGQGIAQSIFG